MPVGVPVTPGLVAGRRTWGTPGEPALGARSGGLAGDGSLLVGVRALVNGVTDLAHDGGVLVLMTLLKSCPSQSSLSLASVWL